jgi:hypothetical protein
MTGSTRLSTLLGDIDPANSPLGTAIASTVVAVLAVLLTFSQPVSSSPGPSAPAHAVAQHGGF